MDDAGIDLAVLSLAAPGVEQLDAPKAVELAREIPQVAPQILILVQQGQEIGAVVLQVLGDVEHIGVLTRHLVDQIAIWVPDEANRRRILVDNAERLYGFERA